MGATSKLQHFADKQEFCLAGRVTQTLSRIPSGQGTWPSLAVPWLPHLSLVTGVWTTHTGHNHGEQSSGFLLNPFISLLPTSVFGDSLLSFIFLTIGYLLDIFFNFSISCALSFFRVRCGFNAWKSKGNNPPPHGTFPVPVIHRCPGGLSGLRMRCLKSGWYAACSWKAALC